MGIDILHVRFGKINQILNLLRGFRRPEKRNEDTFGYREQNENNVILNRQLLNPQIRKQGNSATCNNHKEQRRGRTDQNTDKTTYEGDHSNAQTNVYVNIHHLLLFLTATRHVPTTVKKKYPVAPIITSPTYSSLLAFTTTSVRIMLRMLIITTPVVDTQLLQDISKLLNLVWTEYDWNTKNGIQKTDCFLFLHDPIQENDAVLFDSLQQSIPIDFEQDSDRLSLTEKDEPRE